MKFAITPPPPRFSEGGSMRRILTLAATLVATVSAATKSVPFTGRSGRCCC